MPFLIGLLSAIACTASIFYFLDYVVGESAFARVRLDHRFEDIQLSSNDTSIEKKSLLSDIRSLNNLLSQQKFFRKVNDLFEMSGFKTSLSAFCLLSILGSALVFLSLQMKGVDGLISLGISLFTLAVFPILMIRHKRKKYMDRFSINFPKALQVIRGALTAGLGLGTALDRAAKDSPFPVNVEFDHLMREMSVGRSLIEALIRLHERIPTTDMKTFVVGISVQQESGGNLVELVRNLEDTVQAKVLMRKELRALTAQARVSGWIITLMPPILSVLIKVLNPDYFALLFDTEAGQRLLLNTIILQIIGFIVIKRMVTIKFAA